MNILQGKPIPVYGNSKNVHDWLYVEDHCWALDLILTKGQPGSTYCIAGRNAVANIDLVTMLCDLLDELTPQVPVKPPVSPSRELITYVTDCPGHVLRYSIYAIKIEAELGLLPQVSVQERLRRTVEWYLRHQDWWQPLLPRNGGL